MAMRTFSMLSRTALQAARPARSFTGAVGTWTKTASFSTSADEGEFLGSIPEALMQREAEEHAAWLEGLKTAPIYEPDFYWTLEFVLPPMMELHQYQESPVIVEVQNRDPDADPDAGH